MNCPGHMLLFGSQLRSYRELPLRYAEAAPLHRNELAGALHGLTRVRLRDAGRRAHLLHARADRGRARRLPRLPALPLRPLRDRAARRALDAARQQARHRRGVGLHRGRAAGGARAARDRVRRRRGRGLVLRAEDRPARDRRRSAARGSSARSSSTRRCRPASGSPTWAPTTTEHPAFVVHRALLGSFERFIGILIEHYAGAFPFWLAPVQVRVLPVSEAHREAAARARERLARRGTASRSTTATRRSASGSATPSSRRSRSSSSTATASRTTRSPCASAAASRRRSRLRRLRCAELAYAVSLQAGADPFLTSGRSRARPRGSTESIRRGERAAACSGFCRSRKEEARRAW